MTGEEFLKIAFDLMREAAERHYDLPELWESLWKLMKADHQALGEILGRLPASFPGPRDRELVGMLSDLSAFHAGRLTHEELNGRAEMLLLQHSQHPLFAGYHFHIQSLKAADNPIFNLKQFICPTPFIEMDVLATGCHLCCASWLHQTVGDLFTESYEAVWNSPAAAEIRQTILDGTYRFCNKNACPIICGGLLTSREKLLEDPWWRKVLEEGTGILDRLPRKINLSYDRHCNLACPSCRRDWITTAEPMRRQLQAFTKKNIYPLLASAQEAFITGSGDPFASETFREILAWISDETCPSLQIRLMTNGLLFTPGQWNRFPNLHGKVKLVKVSVDGTNRDTHEKIRRGSNWDVLMRNLFFIGSLLSSGGIHHYELVFVVQEENFREMGDFVDLAKRVGADQVYFERLTNWGTFTEEEYSRRAVFSPVHPRYDEFRKSMEDPRLRDPTVLIGSFGEFLPVQPAIQDNNMAVHDFI